MRRAICGLLLLIAFIFANPYFSLSQQCVTNITNFITLAAGTSSLDIATFLVTGVTLTGNASVTLTDFPGGIFYVTVYQDSVGSHTITFNGPAGYVMSWNGGSMPAVDPTPFGHTFYVFQVKSGVIYGDQIANIGNVNIACKGDLSADCSTVLGVGNVTTGSLAIAHGGTGTNYGASGTWIQPTNNTSTGPTLNKLVVLTGSPPTATIATAGTTKGIQGVCTSNCTNSGSSTVQVAGLVSCIFDGPITAEDYVGVSTSVNGDCHDVGSTQPAGVVTIGTVYSATNGVAGTYLIQIGLPADSVGSGGSGGSVTAGTIGNDVNYSATNTVSPVSYTIHAGSGTLATALAACPASSTIPCIIEGDPGQTYTVSSPLDIGASGYPQTLLLNGASVKCTSTNSDDCIILEQNAKLACTTYLNGSAKTGSIIYAASTAVLNSVVTSSHAVGVTHMNVDGCNIQGNASATINDAVLWVNAVDGYALIQNVTIGAVPVSTFGVLVDDNSSGNLTNRIEFNGLWIAGSGMHITSAQNGTVNVSCIGCAFVDRVSSSPLLQIDTTGSSPTAGVYMPDLYLEVKTGETGDAVLINNARDINLPGLIIDHNGSPTLTNCFHIEGSNTDHVLLQGREIGSFCTTVVRNDVTSYLNTTAGAIEYDYNSTSQGAIPTYDGEGPAVPLTGLLYGNGASAEISPVTATTASISGGGSLSSGSNVFAGTVTSVAATGNVLTPGVTCAHNVVCVLSDETTLGGAKVTSSNTATCTFSATSNDTVDYVSGCR